MSRLLGRPLFWVAALGVLFGVPVARSLARRVPPPPPVLGTLPAFTLNDQQGRRFGTGDLAGKVWVADFIFTGCQQACPQLTARMREVGRRARNLGPDFHLVSISVDPERDTPERLAAYAASYGASPLAWSFLTGPAGAIEAAVTGGFKEAMGREPAGDFWEIFHGEHLVLVDRQLRIRGYFPATPEGLDQLMEAIGRVANGA